MALFKDEKIAYRTVVLDGNEFVACEFQNSRMVYKGGELPKLQQCHFQQCTWELEEAAMRTVNFLRAIFHSGPGGQELVEETLKFIRTP